MKEKTMPIVREAWRFFMRYDKSPKLPNQLRNDEMQIREATEMQRMVMHYRLARSPEEAQRLVETHKAKTAEELLRILYPHPPSLIARLGCRVKSLIERIEGHDRRDLYGKPTQAQTITPKYRFRK
jgi:hypothetical protein